MEILTQEIYDISYYGTPLYQDQKIYILNGDLFADRKELIRYIYESSIGYILGGNNQKLLKRRELMEKVIYLAGHILNEAMVDYREKTT